MENPLKKFFYTSVGFAALAAENVQKITNDLVAEQKLSEKEGEKIVNEFLSDTEAQKEALQERFQELTGTITEKLPFINKKESNEISLENRVAALENKLEPNAAKNIEIVDC